MVPTEVHDCVEVQLSITLTSRKPKQKYFTLRIHTMLIKCTYCMVYQKIINGYLFVL